MRKPGQLGVLRNQCRRQQGQALIIVMTLITVLTLAGAAMAMAVEANMHSLDVVRGLDRIHYAAESAVARGAAATIHSASCPQPGSLNGVSMTITCEDAVQNVDSSQIKGSTLPSQPLAQGGCLSVPLAAAPRKVSLWTLLAWRGPNAAAVKVWVDTDSDCIPSGGFLSPRPTFNSSPAYFDTQKGGWDGDSGQPTLHVVAVGAPIMLGSLNIRQAPNGNDDVVTVVGQSGTEVDESDVLLRDGGPSRVGIWHTVLS